ncbi:NADP-dependent oxidoreductase [Streptomyces sp. G5(2025)]|uniref:NADP-dependent oxidoreductase n=1 Tax=Streptomyces sp. G5(2025) TaxID=3406628 RepID=UPI003C167EAC
MEAVVFEEFGGPEVLGLREIDRPQPGAGQIRVKVRAAGVNPVDYKTRRGWMEEFFPTTLPAVPGREFAGVVAALGEGVTGVAVGDEVFGWADRGSGTYAEYALARQYVRKPAALSWESAAALPVATETAQRVLDLLGVAEGETLLLHGAGGAVGTVAAQLAVARGATVIGTASPAHHGRLRELGVLPVAYGDGLAERVAELTSQRPDGARVDAVFDAAGRGALPLSIELRGGTTDRVVTIADPDAATHGVPFSASAVSDPLPALADHARLAAEGRLRLPVAETFPLADAAKAQELSESGHAGGKLILLPRA